MNRRRTCSMTILNSLFLRNIPGGVPRSPIVPGDVPRNAILFILKWVSLIDVFSYRFNQGIKDGTSGNTPFYSKAKHFGERPPKKTIALLPQILIIYKRDIHIR